MSVSNHLSPLEAATRSRRSSQIFTKRSSAASNSRPVSSSHELRRFDSEEDLIQLNTPRVAASNPSAAIDAKPLSLEDEPRQPSGSDNIWNDLFVRLE